MNKQLKSQVFTFVRAGLAVSLTLTMPGFPIHINLAQAQEIPNKNYLAYQVQAGDTLSQILFRLNMGPLYGRKGLVLRTLFLNRSVLRKNGDMLQPGKIIFLPVHAPEAERLSSLPQKSEVGPLPRIPANTANTSYENNDPKPENIPSNKEAPSVAPPQPLLSAPQPASTSAPQPQPQPNPNTPDAVQMPVSTRDSFAVDFDPYSKVQLKTGADYIFLQGTDRSDASVGRFLSGLSPRAQIDWIQIWNESFSSRIFLSLQSLRLLPDVRGRNITNAQLTNNQFGLGLARSLSDDFSVDLDLKMEQSLFYRALSNTEIEMNQVPLAILRPGFQWRLAHRRSLSFWGVGGISFFSASQYGNYDIEAGTGWDFSFRLQQEFKNHTFDCGLGYSERLQKTTYLNIVQKQAGADCRLTWGQFR